MKLNGEQFIDGDIDFIEHGIIDVSHLINIIHETKDEKIFWSTSDRANIYPSQQSTDIAEFIWTPNLEDEQIFYVYKNQETLNSMLGKMLQEIFNSVTAAVPGNIIKAGLVRLPPGKKIPFHIDGRTESWTSTHRLHLPIITEPEVEFFYESSRKHLPANILTEINNIIPHGVDHNGKNIRYHLMFDVLPSDYTGSMKIVEHTDRSLYLHQRKTEAERNLAFLASVKK